MIARLRPLLVIAVTVGVVVLAGGALIGRLFMGNPEAPGGAEPNGAMRLPDLDGASGWINGGPLGADSLRGHPVVLVHWSDTDPRSLDVLPEVQSWHEAFHRYGVRVIGVYAPDYSFGADPEVPVRVARRLGLSFPSALDPRYRIHVPGGPGRPIIVVADTAGRIVLAADGDRLAEIDASIRDQVRALHAGTGFPAGTGPAAAPPSPEPRFAFLGTARAKRGPLVGAQPGRTLTFTTQFRFQEEGEMLVPYPVGRWTPSAEGLSAARGGAMNYIAIRCLAGRASVVMRPPADGPARMWILEDDAWLGGEVRDEDVRVDARGASYVDVTEPRLYRLSRGSRARVLKLSPEKPGVTVYAFALEPIGVEAGGAVEAGAAARGGP